MKIPFNKPYLVGNEIQYLQDAVNSGKLSGNGMFTKKCHRFFEEKYHFKKCLLTTSCTDALEMSAILLDIQEGDEVIMPSFTFVSTANAFVLRGAKIVFADSYANHPNINPAEIEKLVTPKTKAIVVVHYGGVACDMDKIMSIAERNDIFVIEDAAQAVDSFYKGKPLGGIGHLAAFSFHETKNIISGEGGMLVINDEQFAERAEIIWEKGTNRAAFFRGEVNKYNWVDMGSSFLPSELVASFLFAQLENINQIQKKRIQIWEKYYEEFQRLDNLKEFTIPQIPEYASNNGNMFYVVMQSNVARNSMLEHLKNNGVLGVFHYLSLHKSPFYKNIHGTRELPHCDKFSDRIVRLPFYYELELSEIEDIVKLIATWK